MATLNVTKDDIDEAIKEDGIVLLDFWASWCGPCRVFAPIFEAASERHPDVVFGKVDTEKQPELAEAFRITSIPTLGVFRDGVLLALQPGMLPGPALDELVQRVRDLDMAEVRRRMADARAGSAAEAGR